MELTSFSSSPADLSAYSGSIVILSFEMRSNAFVGSFTTQSEAWVDLVSITDGQGTQFISNGDFESGDLTGWQTVASPALFNMRSGVSNMSGLDVERSFYTVPGAKWGRYADRFVNNTASPISVAVSYYSNLGSDGAGIIYDSTGANGGISEWDITSGDRNLGFVWGTVDSSSYTSAPDFTSGYGSGSDEVYQYYTISLNPGEERTIVNFFIMSDRSAVNSDGASDESYRATDVDSIVYDIFSNFWNNPGFRSGLRGSQLGSILNF